MSPSLQDPPFCGTSPPTFFPPPFFASLHAAPHFRGMSSPLLSQRMSNLCRSVLDARGISQVSKPPPPHLSSLFTFFSEEFFEGFHSPALGRVLLTGLTFVFPTVTQVSPYSF